MSSLKDCCVSLRYEKSIDKSKNPAKTVTNSVQAETSCMCTRASFARCPEEPVTQGKEASLVNVMQLEFSAPSGHDHVAGRLVEVLGGRETMAMIKLKFLSFTEVDILHLH